MNHPSKKRENTIAGVVGIVGGGGLFLAVIVWYFWMVAQPAPPLPGTTLGANSGSGTAAMPAHNDDDVVAEYSLFDIIPLSEQHLNIKSGKAKSVDVPKESGLTAELDGNGVKIVASKDAKEGTYQIKLTSAMGKETIVKVNVKKK
ncbi:MAG: hypothetical protein ACLP9L_36315 [Thermoguttaceae bacterium]